MDKTLHINGNEGTLIDPATRSSISSPNSACDLLVGIGDMDSMIFQHGNNSSSESPVAKSVSDGEPIGAVGHESVEVNDEANNGQTSPQCLESTVENHNGTIHHDIVKDRYNQWAAILGETNRACAQLVGSTMHPMREPGRCQQIPESNGDSGHDEDAVPLEINPQKWQTGDMPTNVMAESSRKCHERISEHVKVLDSGDESSPLRPCPPLHTAVMDYQNNNNNNNNDTSVIGTQDLDQDSDSSEMKHRLAAVLEGAILRGFLQVKFKMGGRRMSTGSIYTSERVETGNHKSLNPSVSALLEPLLAIDEGNMEWRNLILQDFEERQKQIDAVMALKHIEYFVHPLHDAEDPQEQRRRLFPCSDDEVSVMTSDSASSKWSLTASYSNWFGTRSGNKRPNGMKSRLSGRRFIDLTVNNGFHDDLDDDYMLECDDEEGDDASLGKSDSATLYSIPVQKCRTDEERSEARQFLDLTNDTDNDPQHLEGAGNSKRTGFGWMGRQGSMSSLFGSHTDMVNTHAPKCDKYTLDASDDSASLSSEEEADDPRVLTPWEAADVAFIECVHEIAINLERKLNKKGFESPYWSTESIIPPFKGLHEKIKSMVERIKKESDAPPTVAKCLKMTANHQPIGGSKVSRVSLRLSLKLNDIAGRRSLPIQHDSNGGYDDLGMRTLHRDDDAYLKNFLYNFRPDGFCTLPVVLANGLEKKLDHDTVHVALNILGDLTSPLRRRQPRSMSMVSEESDGILVDLSDASYNASNARMDDESIGDMTCFLLAERAKLNNA
jgi:hypothetical protein